MNNKTVTLIKFFKSLARLIILIGLIGSIAELSESTTLLYFLEKSYSKTGFLFILTGLAMLVFLKILEPDLK